MPDSLNHSNVERNEIVLEPKSVDLRSLLEKQCEFYRTYLDAEKKNICLEPNTADTVLYVYPAILGRVIGNMIKNALEATPVG